MPINPFQSQIAPPSFNGFSQGGNAYAVADDASKLFGQALAEYEARAKNPRIDIWGNTLAEDTEPELKKQLIDPLLGHFGLQNFGRPAAALQPKVYHTGNSLVQLDPTTGKTTVVYSQPPKAPPVVKESLVEVPTSFDLLGKPAGKIKATPSQIREGIASGIFPASQVATNQNLQFYNSLTPPGATFTNAVEAGKKMATSAIAPTAFIGTPGITAPINLNPAGGTTNSAAKTVGRFKVISR